MSFGAQKTPSYIVEYKIIVNESDKNFFNHMFWSAQQIQNKIIKHAKNQLQQLNENRDYRNLLKQLRDADKNDKPAIREKLNQIVDTYKIDVEGLNRYATKTRYPYSKYIPAEVATKLSDDVAGAVKKVLYGNGKKLHFKKVDDIKTVSGKRHNGIVFDKNTKVLTILRTHKFKVKIRRNDYYGNRALEDDIKYCGISRRATKTGWDYYLQITFKGTPPAKYSSNGIAKDVIAPDITVGIDPGISTIAATNNKTCLFESLAPDVSKYNDKIDELNTTLEFLRRNNNPKNYNEDGTIKKGRKKWFYSKHYYHVKCQLRNAYRRRHDYIKMSHCKLAKQVLAMGKFVHYEKTDFKELAKRSTEPTKVNEKTGLCEKKKRFGKSVDNHAPAMFRDILIWKLKNQGGILVNVDTAKLKASQYNHSTNTYDTKELGERFTVINDKKVQRDLYSAFIILNCNNNLDKPDITACNSNYESFKKAHDKCVKELKSSNNHVSKNFGIENF